MDPWQIGNTFKQKKKAPKKLKKTVQK